MKASPARAASALRRVIAAPRAFRHQRSGDGYSRRACWYPDPLDPNLLRLWDDHWTCVTKFQEGVVVPVVQQAPAP
ncbi:MAG TPA: hypothetical protein VK816_10450 [Jatrophihabitantaceae bacterium]|nr:hypothetical protein [Jatrophihabitantaceae bacterium]